MLGWGKGDNNTEEAYIKWGFSFIHKKFFCGFYMNVK